MGPDDSAPPGDAPLRILFVTHLYPPQHTAGVEVFASMTAALLRARGHDVSVLTTHKNIARRDLSLVRRSHEGVPVVEITNNLFLERFEQTWRRPEIDAIVGAELDRLRPDVVHVHHLLYLSIGVLEACTDRGIPVVLTLHDFWLGCARFGQLLHADGGRCAHVDTTRCGTCLPSLPWRQTDAARRVARAVGVLRSATGIDASAPLRRLAARGGQAAGDGAADDWVPPRSEVAQQYERDSARRRDEIVRAVNEHAALVLLPAAFMLPWFEGLGVDPARMVVETTGVDWTGAHLHPRVERTPDEPVRVTFVGTLVPHKGAHVLLDAWGRLGPAGREGAALTLRGPDQYQPGYVDALRRRAQALGVELGGRLSRDEVRATMARTDVLVCPSLWFEIRPLVMLEAYAAGARVIATDLGGMAEAVGDGLPGRLFTEGDAAALARALEAEFDLVRGLSGPSRPKATERFRDWPEVAAALVARYVSVAPR